ncbi:DeoR/GlpR family DNA-binding transcription regulator [Ravibacter arvi]|uniref:DeoR/GlpR family DNA-binding transcription regulator n=1 Tax=Ravibacter arvi TaxID=2051041 RepID=A0ABP8MDR1_9BACT
MTSAQRHNEILKLLEERESLDVPVLGEIFGVSAVTVRKDLRLLEEKGLLFRTHGGASRQNPYIRDRNVGEKELLYPEEKARIAAAAAKYVTPNDSVILASGTTLQALARELVTRHAFTAITSSIYVAHSLIQNPLIEVIQLGGSIRHSAGSVSGFSAEGFLENVVCSKLFLGADGIDLTHGLTTTDISEARLNQKMIRASESVIVLADSSKFSKHGFGKICGFEAVSRIITNDRIPAKIAKQLEDMGVAVEIV